MSEAVGSAQGEGHPVGIHLPTTLRFPVEGILARAAMGIAALAAAVALIYVGGLFANMIAFVLLAFGGATLAGNLLALADPTRRAIHLTRDGIAVRYGFSRRAYRFVDYEDFRIGKIGMRRMLTALPLEVGLPVGERHGSASQLLKPAIISPMPPLGGDAPASLSDWEGLLKSLRANAVASAGQKAAKIRLVDRTVA